MEAEVLLGPYQFGADSNPDKEDFQPSLKSLYLG
jgi:hypothetical protein